jgi:hypothetical protein
MAGSFIGYTVGVEAGGSSLVLDPADTSLSISDDDILLVGLYAGNSVTYTPPAGWTAVADRIESPSTKSWQAFWKRASSESGAYTFGLSGSSYGAAQLSCWRGFVGSGSPVHAYSNTGYTTNDTTLRAATLTTTNYSFLVFMGGYNANPPPTGTAPSGFSEAIDYKEDWAYYGTYMAYKDCSAWTGSTGNVDATLSASITGKHGMLIALDLGTAPGAAVKHRLMLMGVG